MKFCSLNAIFIVFYLFICNLKYSEAWRKSHFQVESKLPNECGHSKQISPENNFEHWGFWPWLARVYFKGGSGRSVGILIHPQVVLTSSRHIGIDYDLKLEENLFVVFSNPGHPSFQNISVTHVDVDGTPGSGGLAILKLSKAVIINSQVQPICLWEENHNFFSQLKSHYGIVIGTDIDNLYAENELRAYQVPVRLHNPTIENLENFDHNPKYLYYTYYKDPILCHALGSSLMLPRISESGDIVWFMRSIINNNIWNCNNKDKVLTADMGYSRPWIESHFKPSSETKCGRRVVSITPLVISGDDTTRGDWPWHAAIFLDGKKKKSREYRCGGSLISATYVLTASHCVFSGSDLLDGKLSVKLGKYNLSRAEEGSLYLRVAEIIPHEHYNGTLLRNDIALLRLPRDVTFNNFIQPICLWNGDDPDKKKIVNKVGKVPGWGLNENDETPNNLFVATIPIVDDTFCYQSHPTFYNFLTDYTLCAGNARAGSGVCNGDSGGGLVFPITQDDQEATWYLRGIVSLTVRKTNHKTCDPNYNAVYTDVAKYLDWINYQITVYNSTTL